MGHFAFFEGNGASQDKLGNDVSDAPGQSYNLKNDNPTKVDNDEARSVVLFNVRAGAILSVYDDPKGQTGDDWCEIVVKRQVQEKVIRTFEDTFEDDDVRVTYHRKNGLDGKVSHIQVS